MVAVRYNQLASEDSNAPSSKRLQLALMSGLVELMVQ